MDGKHLVDERSEEKRPNWLQLMEDYGDSDNHYKTVVNRKASQT